MEHTTLLLEVSVSGNEKQLAVARVDAKVPAFHAGNIEDLLWRIGTDDLTGRVGCLGNRVFGVCLRVGCRGRVTLARLVCCLSRGSRWFLGDGGNFGERFIVQRQGFGLVLGLF